MAKSSRVTEPAEPKIHLAKWVINETLSPGQVAIMKVRYGTAQHTDREWAELLDYEMSRRVS
ncbi:hypothetical protein CMI37_03155 [Candidatus Pacearchaeota archaeon]|nr:hypothetical protein [Candidatus Pacearchaeota archaeon]